MQKFYAATLGTIFMTGAALAGQIQIGGANGLTASYITSGCSTNVIAQTCVSGSVGTFVEQNYDQRLFQNSNPAAVPYPGYSTTAADGGATATTGFLTGSGTYDTGIVFNMINDGLTSGSVSANFWEGAAANATITIPIGIFGASDAWLMLNNIWGPSGGSDTVVTFNFGSLAANAVTNSVVVNLTNAGNTTSSPSGQIGTSVNCDTTQTTTCNTFAVGQLAANTPNIGGTGVTVDTDNVMSSGYSSISSGKFSGTAGHVTLDDQDFIFPTVDTNEYLVSISVKELSGAAQTSQTALSAITVDTVPEPASVALVLGGLALLGVSRLRKKAV